MNLGELKERRDALRDRHNVITAELAEMKRAKVVDGVEADFKHRCVLEAEKAQGYVELQRIEQKLHASRKAESAIKRASFTAVLVSMLQERDLSELVREAERKAGDMMVLACQKNYEK